MAPPDETWVPEWEPKEEETPRLTHLSAVGNDESETPRSLLEDDDILDSATSQHQALAEEVMQANAREHRQQAVAAAMPGVDSGILGFEDVTGRTGMATEEVEAAEQARSSDLVRRTISAVALVAVVVLALYLGEAWLTGLFVLAMVVGLVEFYMAVRSAGYRPVALVGMLGALGAGVAAHLSGLAAAGGTLAAAVGLLLLFYVASPRRMSAENSTLTVMGMVWMSLLCYGVVIGRAEDGVVLLVWVLLLNSVFDTAAYVVGRAFGTGLSRLRCPPKRPSRGCGRGGRRFRPGRHPFNPSPAFDSQSRPGPLSGGGGLGAGAVRRRRRIGGQAVDGGQGHEFVHPRTRGDSRSGGRAAAGAARRLLSLSLLELV